MRYSLVSVGLPPISQVLPRSSEFLLGINFESRKESLSFHGPGAKMSLGACKLGGLRHSLNTLRGPDAWSLPPDPFQQSKCPSVLRTGLGILLSLPQWTHTFILSRHLAINGGHWAKVLIPPPQDDCAGREWLHHQENQGMVPVWNSKYSHK